MYGKLATVGRGLSAPLMILSPEAAFEKFDDVKQCQLDCKSNCAFRPVASTAVLEFGSSVISFTTLNTAGKWWETV